MLKGRLKRDPTLKVKTVSQTLNMVVKVVKKTCLVHFTRKHTLMTEITSSVEFLKGGGGYGRSGREL